jgi:hypothetical protein
MPTSLYFTDLMGTLRLRFPLNFQQNNVHPSWGKIPTAGIE